MAVGVVVWGVRLLRKVMKRPEGPTVSESLRPGETLIIEAQPPERRRKGRTAS